MKLFKSCSQRAIQWRRPSAPSAAKAWRSRSTNLTRIRNLIVGLLWLKQLSVVGFQRRKHKLWPRGSRSWRNRSLHTRSASATISLSRRSTERTSSSRWTCSWKWRKSGSHFLKSTRRAKTTWTRLPRSPEIWRNKTRNSLWPKVRLKRIFTKLSNS